MAVKAVNSNLYNTAETITLPLTKLEVKYIKPDAVQASTFQYFIVDSISKLTLSTNEINALTFKKKKKKANTLFTTKTSEEVSSLLSEMLLVGIDNLLQVIIDCFPEVTNPRLIKGVVLDDMIKVLFSTVFS